MLSFNDSVGFSSPFRETGPLKKRSWWEKCENVKFIPDRIGPIKPALLKPHKDCRLLSPSRENVPLNYEGNETNPTVQVILRK
jgi:hypothetical protein